MNDKRNLSLGQLIWKEAVIDEMPRDERFRVLEFGLAESVLSRHPTGIEKVTHFLNPQTPCATLSGEPGWTIYRKPEVGEPRRWALDVNSNGSYQGNPVPVPAAEQGPHSSWPASARYFAEAMDLNDMGDPDYPEEYFTAAEVHAYLARLMPVYAKYHPESAAACERVVSLSKHWVDLDTQAGQN